MLDCFVMELRFEDVFIRYVNWLHIPQFPDLNHEVQTVDPFAVIAHPAFTTHHGYVSPIVCVFDAVVVIL